MKVKGIDAIAPNTKPSLASKVRSGAGALSASHRSLITFSSRVLDSINLDEALMPFYPSDHRWDYAVAVYCNGGIKIAFIEVHDASSSKTAKVVKEKLKWLQNWLKSGGKPLTKFLCKFYWIASGRIGIPPRAPVILELAGLGLPPPKRHLKITC
ncbi:MAG: hypothetical protein N2253_09110 [Bacteroidia bacterium]|nr:hypothetical protein [Bacteroidia bacterium]